MKRTFFIIRIIGMIGVLSKALGVMIDGFSNSSLLKFVGDYYIWFAIIFLVGLIGELICWIIEKRKEGLFNP